MFLAQTARLLVGNCNHLLPPRADAMLAVQARDELLVIHRLATGGVENLEPFILRLAGLVLDRLVADARGWFRCLGCCAHLGSLQWRLAESSSRFGAGPW